MVRRLELSSNVSVLLVLSLFTYAVTVSQWKRGLPIEVISFAYKVVKLKIEKSLGGLAELRMAKQKAVSHE